MGLSWRKRIVDQKVKYNSEDVDNQMVVEEHFVDTDYSFFGLFKRVFIKNIYQSVDEYDKKDTTIGFKSK